MAKVCEIKGCDKPTVARGWCDGHYTRYKRHGDPTFYKWSLGYTFERFFDQVNLDGPVSSLGTPCWVWLGRKNSKGYGLFKAKDWNSNAHGWIYRELVGPVPEDKELDHFACDRRECVNPSHMRPVSHRENVLRGKSAAAQHAAQTHCVNGHPFNKQNTDERYGRRYCRQCARDRQRKYRERGGA